MTKHEFISCNYHELCREIGESFEESLRGGKHVKNLEMFRK